jgi:hypothetical protein
MESGTAQTNEVKMRNESMLSELQRSLGQHGSFTHEGNAKTEQQEVQNQPCYCDEEPFFLKHI